MRVFWALSFLASVRDFLDKASLNNVAFLLFAITIGELRQGVEKIRHRGDSAQAPRF
jgi:hypothetical protein